jgi:hypothetical protein
MLTPCSPDLPWAQPVRVRDIAVKLAQVARVALAVYGIPAPPSLDILDVGFD